MKFIIKGNAVKEDLIIEGGNLSVSDSGAVTIKDRDYGTIAVFPAGTTIYAEEKVVSGGGDRKLI